MRGELRQLQTWCHDSVGSCRKAWPLLVAAADLVRRLGGARVTMCKSGKDRTGMSVSYEQCRALRDGLGGFGHAAGLGGVAPLTQRADFERARHLLRMYGVRLENCHKNIGKLRYAFNAFQQKMLPHVYRPPVSVAGKASS